MESVKGCAELVTEEQQQQQEWALSICFTDTCESTCFYICVYMQADSVYIYTFMYILRCACVHIASSVFAVDSTFPFGQQRCFSVGGSLLIPLCSL